MNISRIALAGRLFLGPELFGSYTDAEVRILRLRECANSRKVEIIELMAISILLVIGGGPGFL
jgi:hypothetical protein